MEKVAANIRRLEAFEHLQNGRYRIALNITEQLIQEQPNDFEIIIYHSWALLENGNPVKALKYLNKSFDLANDSVVAQMYRGYLQMRLSLFEGAVYDFNMTQDRQKEFLALSYYNKAKSLAGINEFERALSSYDLALMIDRGTHQDWIKSKKYFNKAIKFAGDRKNISNIQIPELIELAQKALLEKEYWFSLLIAREVPSLITDSKLIKNLELLELESMFSLNQILPCKKKMELLCARYPGDEKVIMISKALEQISEKAKEEPGEPAAGGDFILNVKEELNEQYKLEKYQNAYTEITFLELYDASSESSEVIYLNELDIKSTKKLGTRLRGKNYFYNKESKTYNFFIVWYLEDEVIGQNGFKVDIAKDWDQFEFTDYCDVWQNRFWTKGKGWVEIYFDRVKVAERHFVVGKQAVAAASVDSLKNAGEYAGNKTADGNDKQDFSLDEIMEELNKNIGLNSIKKSIKEMIDYLEFMKERKQLGLKAQDRIVINATFLGNPGTGKTTIARLMGKIFKRMGILSKGEVIEVDRAGLVGQYVGETAQKTEKVIESAMGSVLFIDEAYALVKSGGGNDFGREAIDTLLKRMEDKKGEFALIVAGYPKEMEEFLDSNPGMKSRMTHNFLFEDYTPEEMILIFEKMLKDEDYKITPQAEKLLLKHFTVLYRNRDKSFGNARTVRRYFEDAKITLSKHYLQLPKHLRTKEKLMTISEEDIQEIFEETAGKIVDIPINEEALAEAINELESLTGLDSVKNDVREMIKLARYYKSNGESLQDKLSSHVLFFGNPGTGKTTVARILGKIYSALGILSKGHLVETDRQGLVASYVGQTAEKTTAIIKQAMNGTLFIDEAYALVKNGDSGNDFGKEAIDTLLKRMEDDRGKFIVIAAGYTDEMKKFLESNPGMKSRFTKIFNFEDYSPVELIEIAERIAKSKLVEIEDATKQQILKYFNEIYRSRDKSFGNARIVRNLMDGAMRKQILRLSELPAESVSAEMRSKLMSDDFEELHFKVKAVTRPAAAGDSDLLGKYLQELKQMIGLQSIKESVEKLIGSLKIANVRRDRGLQVTDKPLHSVFVGNPGTGKTTVARLLSKIFKELGILEKGHLVEVDRAQLVAGYQGQTASKTDSIIEKALGGTLFIDEAYTLSRGANDFGQEAIDTLLKRMEYYSGKFVTIVAGYPKEMQTFLNSNPGLSSRFTNYYNFEDYAPAELEKILENLISTNGYVFSPDAWTKAQELIAAIYNKRDKNFGNARTIRNMFFDIISCQEERLSRVLNYNDRELTTITMKDVAKVKV